MYYCILLGLCRSCAPRFLLCISLYASFFFSSLVPCPVPSVCMYSVLLHIWRPAYRSCIPLFGTHCPSVVFLPSDDSAVFASDCIDTANLPHLDFVFIHPSSSASLVAGRLNYGVVQAVSAANVRGSVIRAHDVRKFAFSVNWTRRANLPHILWVLGISSPFSLPLPHYMSVRPSQLCSCGVPSVNGLSGPAGLPRLRVFSPSDARWLSVGLLCSANVPISVFYHVPCALFFVVVCTYCM